ncbi:uncharacterized protein SCHCODRAFT_01165443 [Schizophyllum commune H4-8]|nr:uncharacterized protein SCHCODRAFT_01165443 [Schizophyllum commune H4-8]KAI5893028.1 hypothetical protein SCHCODRAFT_01165443 [Schizophyllum commune H4-8]
MRLNLTSLLALLSLAITASAAGCDCFDYTAADAGDKCDGGYNSNKADIDAHCKDSGIKTAAATSAAERAAIYNARM